MKNIMVYLWAVAIFAGALSTPPGLRAEDTQETHSITSIKIEGNKNIPPLVIYGHLDEKEGDVYSLRRVRADIHNLFSTGDFSDVQVDAEPGPKQGQVILIFKLVERPLVSKILFKGNRKWDAHKFADEIKTAAKSPYDPSLVNDDAQAIRKLYLDEGYPNVVVSAKADVNEGANTVDVTFEINEGLQIKIGSITVLGSEAFSGKKVEDQMKDNRKGDKYKPDLLPDDLKKIEDFYHDEGYLKAAVLSHEEKINEAKRRVAITLTVREGLQYTTGKVQFQGNSVFDDDELSKALGLTKDAILRKKDLDEGERKIKVLYADKGYIYSNLTPDLEYDEDLKKVNMSFNIVEGQMAYVQDIKIVGNYKTQDYVIRRELAIKAGDKFEASKIRESAQNLNNLGFFDEVDPEVEPGDEPGKEILVFRVKERKTGSISLGGGYSSVDGLVGNVKLEEANLFGKAQHVSLNVEFGASRTSFDASFSEPWLFNTPTSLGVNLFDTTRIYTTAVADPDGTNDFYTETQIGGSISVGRKLSRYWSVFGAYSLQDVEIYDVDKAFATPPSGGVLNSGVSYIAATDTITSSFTPRIVYDSRDNYFDPTTGWKNQLSVEFAGGPLGAQNNFIKAILDSSHFVPLPLDFVFAEHVRFGAAQGYRFGNGPFTDVPLFEKFYAGGTDTIRGYTERSVGPLLGGNSLFVSNTEIKHALVGPLRGVLFFDAGDAWSSLWNIDSNESRMEYGAGVGLRLTIPGTLIAIRLDYGWPVATDLNAGLAPRGGTLHFNLGDLF